MSKATDYLLNSSGAPDWALRVIQNTEPESNGFYFDWEEADRRVRFIESHCRYPEGASAGKVMTLYY